MNGDCFVLFGMGMEMDGIEVSESGVCFHDNRDGFGLILQLLE